MEIVQLQAGTTYGASSRVFDPELFSHSPYVKLFVTLATKVPYLTFCDKMRQFFIKEMDRDGGNKEKMRKCRE